ncbi:MFS transporter [Bacillus sp. V3-13]|uniref:MFS transporter n=1 Tax=Bacillus sp. V3-13 TaxID=2053728 RepID=UPI000C76AFFD|nr:MFS transporter [Bacillus sp. V3-13]PLR75914.1 MFS transporter [Bacillus sp. V3-13]
MEYIQSGTKESRLASISLFLGGFVTFAILYTTQPLMPVFTKEFGVSAPVASLSLSLSTGLLAIVMLIAAALSDAVGKRTVMIFSMLSTSILGLLSAFSPNFMTLLIYRALLGIFIAGIPSIAMAYVSEEFNPKEIGKVMGLYISGTSIGGLAGRIFTSALTDLFTWRIALTSVGVMTILLSIAFWLTLPAPRHHLKKPLEWKAAFAAYQSHFKNKQLMTMMALPFLLMGSFVTLYNYIGFLLVEPPYNLSQTVVGFIFVVYLFGTFSSIYMGKKADQYGNSKTLKISLGIMIGGVILTIVPFLLVKILGISIFTFGFFACHSIASAWVGESAVNFKAQASALYLLFYYLGSSLVGSFGGYFWVHFHWIGIVSLIFGLLLAGYLLIVKSEKSLVTKNKTYNI